MKVVCIIQARTSSTRLPAKVLKSLPFGSGTTVLHQVINRVKKTSLVDEVVVATTEEKEDKAIVDIARECNVGYYRGDKEDVLRRYYETAVSFKADVIVRITSDCPCIDQDIIARAIELHLQEQADYTHNPGYPLGFSVEVASFEALERAHKEAKEPYEREHVFPYIHTTAKDKFRITELKAPPEFRRNDIRVTLDTEEDYALLCAVYDFLYPSNPFFGIDDVVKLFNKKGWLSLINKKVMQKKIYLAEEEELEDAIHFLEMQEMHRAKEILKKYMEGLK